MRLNFATRLTLLRIFLVPVIAVAMLYDHHALALGLFALAAVTDAADGIIARRWHQRSTLGAILDPLADKALLMTVFILMGGEKPPFVDLPTWLIAAVIFRDALILVGLGVMQQLGVTVRWGPSWISKVNTNAQIFTVAAAMVANALIEAALWPALLGLILALLTGLIWATLATTVASGLDYTLQGIRMLGESPLGQLPHSHPRQ